MSGRLDLGAIARGARRAAEGGGATALALASGGAHDLSVLGPATSDRDDTRSPGGCGIVSPDTSPATRRLEQPPASTASYGGTPTPVR